MSKWVYPLLIAFVAFFIFTTPVLAGSAGRAFVEFLGDLAGAAGEFLEGVFNDDAPNDNNVQPNRSGGGGGDAPANSGDPSYDRSGSSEPPTSEGSGDRFETLAPLTR